MKIALLSVVSLLAGAQAATLRYDIERRSEKVEAPSVSGFSKEENNVLAQNFWKSHDRAVDVSDGFQGSEINGRKIVKPAEPISQKNILSHRDALAQTDVFTNLDLNDKLKNGSLTSLHMSQKDVNILSHVGSSPVNAFYEDMPVNDVNLNPITSSPETQFLARPSQELLQRHQARVKPSKKRAGQDLDLTLITPAVHNPFVDVFYHPVASWVQSLTNGDVLAFRLIQHDLIRMPALTLAYQVSFRTESTFGGPLDGITTLFIPPEIKDAGSVVTSLFHEDGITLQCSTSFTWAYLTGDSHLQSFLENGWVVNAPDYEGPNSALFATILNTKNSLDSQRATVQLRSRLNFRAERFVIYGYSASAIVAGYILEYVDKYAPEFAPGGRFPIIGAAIGGFVTDLGTTIDYINRGMWGAFPIMGFFGIGTEYPRVTNLVYDRLKDPMSTLRAYTAYLFCAVLDVAFFYGQDYRDLLSDRGQVIHHEYIQDVMRNNSLGVYQPVNVPVYILQSATDEVAFVGRVDDTVNRWCQHGLHVTYNRDPGPRAHLDEESRGVDLFASAIRRMMHGDTGRPCTWWQDAIERI